MSERVLSGAAASTGLAIGRARVLVHPADAPARDPGPTRQPDGEAEHARRMHEVYAEVIEERERGGHS